MRRGDGKRNILLEWPNTIGYPEFEGLLIWGEPAGLAGLAHFTKLASLMPCFLLKFLLCFYMRRRAGPLAVILAQSSQALSRPGQPAFQYKHNKLSISKQWAQLATDCNWAGSPHLNRPWVANKSAKKKHYPQFEYILNYITIIYYYFITLINSRGYMAWGESRVLPNETHSH